MNVRFKDSFDKDLAKLKDKTLLRRVKELIEFVERSRRLSDLRNLKKIKGGGAYYRIRVGDYRVGLTVDPNTITFVRLLHRKEIYRYFP